MPEPPKLVLFLGAGFSWDARLPLMSEFGPESVRTQPGVPRNASAYESGPMIEEARRTYVAFEALCRSSGLLCDRDWHNVENVFGVAEILKYTGVPSVDLDGQVVEIDDLIARIQVWIWKTYQQLPVKRGQERPEAKPNREPYWKLFRALRDLGVAPRTTIITTNYDIVVEYFAYLTDIKVHYPFAWDTSFGITKSGSRFVAEPGDSRAGPILCKLHGSVNYFQSPAGFFGVTADLGDGREPVGRTGPRSFKDEPTVAMYDAIASVRKRVSGALPAIVPPSYAKLDESAWLRATWKRAAEDLAAAERIVFIGYSMPRTDGFMRGMLVGSCLGRGGRVPPVVVIDTCDDVLEEYDRIFHKTEPGHTMAFSRAVDDVLPAVLAEAAS
jgi:hypothetical protein